MRPGAVTFDFGQTLTELDCDLLCERLAEKGISARPERLRAAMPGAWRLYDRACAGTAGAHPWHLLMKTILQEGGVRPTEIDAAVDWLWSEQPVQNLWRKPIPGMIDIVRKISSGGTKVAVISNSEGRLAELASELGWQDDFELIADSGRLGFQKPGAQIFQWTATALGVAPADFVHVGDSWAADVQGMLALGGRAIWFGGATMAPSPPADAEEGPRLRLCRSPTEVEAALRSFEVPL